MDNTRNITNYDLDILGELGNIGAGNAATALAQILNQTVLLEVPLVGLYELTEIPEVLGGAEALRTGCFFGVKDGLSGHIMFILEDKDVDKICNIVAGDYEVEKNSVVQEISNIISGAYVGALASLINEKIDITPPEVGRDMLGSLIDCIISSLCLAADKTVIIGTKLTIGGETISAFYVLLLEKESLNKLLDYFNK